MNYDYALMGPLRGRFFYLPKKGHRSPNSVLTAANDNWRRFI